MERETVWGGAKRTPGERTPKAKPPAAEAGGRLKATEEQMLPHPQDLPPRNSGYRGKEQVKIRKGVNSLLTVLTHIRRGWELRKFLSFPWIEFSLRIRVVPSEEMWELVSYVSFKETNPFICLLARSTEPHGDHGAEPWAPSPRERSEAPALRTVRGTRRGIRPTCARPRCESERPGTAKASCAQRGLLSSWKPVSRLPSVHCAHSLSSLSSLLTVPCEPPSCSHTNTHLEAWRTLLKTNLHLWETWSSKSFGENGWDECRNQQGHSPGAGERGAGEIAWCWRERKESFARKPGKYLNKHGDSTIVEKGQSAAIQD